MYERLVDFATLVIFWVTKCLLVLKSLLMVSFRPLPLPLALGWKLKIQISQTHNSTKTSLTQNLKLIFPSLWTWPLQTWIQNLSSRWKIFLYKRTTSPRFLLEINAILPPTNKITQNQTWNSIQKETQCQTQQTWCPNSPPKIALSLQIRLCQLNHPFLTYPCTKKPTNSLIEIKPSNAKNSDFLCNHEISPLINSLPLNDKDFSKEIEISPSLDAFNSIPTVSTQNQPQHKTTPLCSLLSQGLLYKFLKSSLSTNLKSLNIDKGLINKNPIEPVINTLNKRKLDPLWASNPKLKSNLPIFQSPPISNFPTNSTTIPETLPEYPDSDSSPDNNYISVFKVSMIPGHSSTKNRKIFTIIKTTNGIPNAP